MDQPIERVETSAEPQKQFKRFVPSQRMEHILLLVTFTGLALTGLPQKYAAEDWAKAMIGFFGGIESIRIIHHFLATLLMAEAIYHGGVISYKLYVLGRRATMIPGIKDARDVIQWIAFNLGLGKSHPHLPRYNFGEKVEYLAVVWGTIVMAVTGFMMWNPITTSKVLPGSVIPAARAAHGAEAVLAVLSIVIWHMYNVHIRRFNKSMFTGNISREAMEEEHAEELDEITRGETETVPPPAVIAKRRRRFVPYAVIMTVLLVAGLIWFITFEDTAITTVPRQNVVVFEPQVTLSAGDPAVGAAMWSTLRCARCHGDEAQGSPDAPQLRGITMTFDQFYAQVRTGVPGKMPAFSAGEIPDPYLLHLWTWLSSVQERTATDSAGTEPAATEPVTGE